jgi:adenylate kinase
MKLIIIGIQGSGKGTQSQLIAKEFGLKHVSTGDLIREEIKMETEDGKKAEGYANKGLLVANELVEKILFKHLPGDNYVLDGYPRNLEQARKLEKVNKPDKVIFLELSDEEVFRRIGNRYSCKKCGINYGLSHMPKRQWFCDVCGERLEKRKDDNEESIKIRIGAFKKETLPLLDFYEERVIKTDGSGSAEDVFEKIKKLLK